MNTVDALNVLGKALCGDSFEVKPGLTDAETILEIAKNYEGGSGESVKLTFPVEMEGNPLTGAITCTTDFDDIIEAVNAGKTLELIITVDGQEYSRSTSNGWCITQERHSADGPVTSLIITATSVGDSALIVNYCTINNNGTVDMPSNFNINADSPIIECHLREEHDSGTGTTKYYFTNYNDSFDVIGPNQHAGVIFKVTESDSDYFTPYYFKAEGRGNYIWYFDNTNVNCLVSSRYSIGSTQIYPHICWLTFNWQDAERVELIINQKTLSGINI